MSYRVWERYHRARVWARGIELGIGIKINNAEPAYPALLKEIGIKSYCRDTDIDTFRLSDRQASTPACDDDYDDDD